MTIFVNAVDLRMSERDFNSWMFQLANENREGYRLGMKLQNYTMAIEMKVGIPLILMRREPMFTFGRVERYRAAKPGIRGSAGPQIHISDCWYKV